VPIPNPDYLVWFSFEVGCVEQPHQPLDLGDLLPPGLEAQFPCLLFWCTGTYVYLLGLDGDKLFDKQLIVQTNMWSLRCW